MTNSIIIANTITLSLAWYVIYDRLDFVTAKTAKWYHKITWWAAFVAAVVLTIITSTAGYEYLAALYNETLI